MLDSNIRLPVL